MDVKPKFCKKSVKKYLLTADCNFAFSVFCCYPDTIKIGEYVQLEYQ